MRLPMLLCCGVVADAGRGRMLVGPGMDRRTEGEGEGGGSMSSRIVVS